MNIAQDARDYLLEDHSVAAAVGTRVYPAHLPQRPTLPAIVYQVISRSHLNHLGGIADAGQCRLQWDAYAATQAEADALADLMLARWRTLAATGPTTIGDGTAVCDVEMFGPIQRPEAPDDGSDQWTYVSSLDVVLSVG